jgi:hypothetical protein
MLLSDPRIAQIFDKTSEWTTPYALAKASGKRGQMAYNYIRKGYITVHENEVGHLVVDRTEATRVQYLWTCKEVKSASQV